MARFKLVNTGRVLRVSRKTGLLNLVWQFWGLRLLEAARGADAEIRSKARANGIILTIIGGNTRRRSRETE